MKVASSTLIPLHGHQCHAARNLYKHEIDLRCLKWFLQRQRVMSPGIGTDIVIAAQANLTEAKILIKVTCRIVASHLQKNFGYASVASIFDNLLKQSCPNAVSPPVWEYRY